MQYTIAVSEIEKLKQARDLQVARARRILTERENAPSDAPNDERVVLAGLADDASVAPVEWRNGIVDVRPLNLALLAKWTKLLPANAVRIAFDVGKVTFAAGGSQLTLADVRDERYSGDRQWQQCKSPVATPAELAKLYGEPLVMDGNPGVYAGTDAEWVFHCLSTVNAAELKALKTAERSSLKAERGHKLIVKAAKVARAGKGRLAILVKDNREAIARMAGADPSEWPRGLRVQEFPTCAK